MSTRGQFNTKNPTIKRILKEASELSASPSPDYHAEPQETNLFEWHFTIRGPPAPSPYAPGIYHGRIILPPQYPLRPPSFRFLTPTGRFEVNREICLSISGHHEETWQPAWGVRTALVAIRSFMDTDAKGQLGGIECSKDARERLASESVSWKCPACAKSNAEILKEREELVKLAEEKQGKRAETEVPEELRLAYRDELGKGSASAEQSDSSATRNAGVPSPPPSSQPQHHAPVATPSTSPSSTPSSSSSSSSTKPNIHTSPQSTPRHPPQTPQLTTRRQSPDVSPPWLDTCIYTLAAALLFMVFRKFII